MRIARSSFRASGIRHIADTSCACCNGTELALPIHDDDVVTFWFVTPRDGHRYGFVIGRRLQQPLAVDKYEERGVLAQKPRGCGTVDAHGQWQSRMSNSSDSQAERR